MKRLTTSDDTYGAPKRPKRRLPTAETILILIVILAILLIIHAIGQVAVP